MIMYSIVNVVHHVYFLIKQVNENGCFSYSQYFYSNFESSSITKRVILKNKPREQQLFCVILHNISVSSANNLLCIP